MEPISLALAIAGILGSVGTGIYGAKKQADATRDAERRSGDGPPAPTMGGSPFGGMMGRGMMGGIGPMGGGNPLAKLLGPSAGMTGSFPMPQGGMPMAGPMGFLARGGQVVNPLMLAGMIPGIGNKLGQNKYGKYLGGNILGRAFGKDDDDDDKKRFGFF